MKKMDLDTKQRIDELVASFKVQQRERAGLQADIASVEVRMEELSAELARRMEHNKGLRKAVSAAEGTLAQTTADLSVKRDEAEQEADARDEAFRALHDSEQRVKRLGTTTQSVREHALRHSTAAHIMRISPNAHPLPCIHTQTLSRRRDGVSKAQVLCQHRRAHGRLCGRDKRPDQRAAGPWGGGEGRGGGMKGVGVRAACEWRTCAAVGCVAGWFRAEERDCRTAISWRCLSWTALGVPLLCPLSLSPPLSKSCHACAAVGSVLQRSGCHGQWTDPTPRGYRVRRIWTSGHYSHRFTRSPAVSAYHVAPARAVSVSEGMTASMGTHRAAAAQAQGSVQAHPSGEDDPGVPHTGFMLVIMLVKQIVLFPCASKRNEVHVTASRTERIS